MYIQSIAVYGCDVCKRRTGCILVYPTGVMCCGACRVKLGIPLPQDMIAPERIS